jgi:hypothetical protein
MPLGSNTEIAISILRGFLGLHLLLLLDDRLLPLGSLSQKHPLRRQVNHLSLYHGVNKRSGVH